MNLEAFSPYFIPWDHLPSDFVQGLEADSHLSVTGVVTLNSAGFIHLVEYWADPARMRHCRIFHHCDMPMADDIMIAYSVFPFLVCIHRVLSVL